MADDRSGVTTLENCIPITRVPIMEADQGRAVTRPWTWFCNGKVTQQGYIDNGSILPNGEIDVRNVAMGYDAYLTLSDDGTELAQIYRLGVYVDPTTERIQPLGSRRGKMRVTGGDVTCEFAEYVLNDTILLKKVLPSMITDSRDGDSCDSYLNLTAVLQNRTCA